MKPEIKYGLFAGLGMCAWILIEFILGLHTTRPEIGEYTGYFSNAIPLVALFLLLRQKQDATYDGRLTFSQGIGSGLLASFIGALIVYAFMLAYNLHINPDWIDHALEWKVAQLRAIQTPESEIRRQITFYREANTATGLIATTLLGITATGGFFSFLLTLLLRVRKKSSHT